MESEDHETSLMVGLAGLRDQGLLLDTCLWAEGEKYQVKNDVDAVEILRTKNSPGLLGLITGNNRLHNSRFIVHSSAWSFGQ